MFIYSDYQVENEDEADDELILVGLEVRELEEDEASLSILTSGWQHFPLPNSTLSADTKHAVLVPDSGLSSLYGDTRVTVHHEPSEIARCLLGGNYLPPEVFGRDADIDLRARVFEEVGLTDNGVSDDQTEYRNALREIAGLTDEVEEDDSFETEAERLKAEHKYSELQNLAKEAGIEDARTSKDDLAEYIVENDD